MDPRERAKLCAELHKLVACSPGDHPIQLIKARVLLVPWTRHTEADIRAKARAALDQFEVWFSRRRWNRSRDSGRGARELLKQSLKALQAAIAC